MANPGANQRSLPAGSAAEAASSPDTVSKLAQLSKLELSEDETRLFATQLSQVLSYMEQLQEAEVAEVEPMIHPLELATPLREDVVHPSPVDPEGKPKMLQSAPDVFQDGFKVPPIL